MHFTPQIHQQMIHDHVVSRKESMVITTMGERIDYRQTNKMTKITQLEYKTRFIQHMLNLNIELDIATNEYEAHIESYPDVYK